MLFMWSINREMIIHEQSLKCDCDKTKLKPNEFYKNRSTQSQTHVLIISEARSGSSFLGDLLQHVTLTYYSFEPLIGIDPGSPLYQSLIYDLFSCQFDHLSNSYLLPIYWKIQYLKWNSMLVKAIDQNDRLQLFNHTIHRWLCRNAETILIKTIRYTIADLWKQSIEMENFKQIDFKVIFLVRDPRAVMSSRYRMTWCQNTENCTNSEMMCDRMRMNIEMFRQLTVDNERSIWLNRIVILRHEDLIMDMLNISRRLLKFLEMQPLDQRMIEWIREHTSMDDILGNPHSTYRDIKSLANQWIAELNADELAEIETNCMGVMEQLGYRPSKEWFDSDEQSDSESSVSHDYPLSRFSLSRA